MLHSAGTGAALSKHTRSTSPCVHCILGESATFSFPKSMSVHCCATLLLAPAQHVRSHAGTGGGNGGEGGGSGNGGAAAGTGGGLAVGLVAVVSVAAWWWRWRRARRMEWNRRRPAPTGGGMTHGLCRPCRTRFESTRDTYCTFPRVQRPRNIFSTVFLHDQSKESAPPRDTHDVDLLYFPCG